MQPPLSSLPKSRHDHPPNRKVFCLPHLFNANVNKRPTLLRAPWQTLVRMARAYITEKQVGREFWYFSIKHAAQMLNQVPGRLGRKLTTPFELVYNQKPDSRTWFELFSIGYFPIEKKAGDKASATECHTMDGIAVGRDEKSNTIIFYNPLTKSYYSPPVFKLDTSHLPVMLYPKHIRYDGGFVCGPLRNRTDPVPEPFLPGTRVEIDVNGDKCKGTIQNVPLPFSNIGATTVITSSPPSPDDIKTTYTVHLDSGKTVEVLYEDLFDPITSTQASPSGRVRGSACISIQWVKSHVRSQWNIPQRIFALLT
jgi:hypothetical protein